MSGLLRLLAGARASLLWAAVVAFAIVLAAFVALSMAGIDPAKYIELLVLLAGLAGLGQHNAGIARNQDRKLDTQDRKLDTITRQTNGVLDQRIRDGVNAVLDDRLARITPAAG